MPGFRSKVGPGSGRGPLCGAGAGRDFVRHGFRLLPHQRCGDHDARTYVMKVTLLKQQFAQLAGGSRSIRAGR